MSTKYTPLFYNNSSKAVSLNQNFSSSVLKIRCYNSINRLCFFSLFLYEKVASTPHILQWKADSGF